MKQRKLILYIAMSLDGFIADKNDGLDFLNVVQAEGEDYGYNDFFKSVDTVIIGRKTFEKIISLGVEQPHYNKTVYVITRETRKDEPPYHFFNGDLKELVFELKASEGLDIYCDGGAEVANELLRLKLIDELVISIIPTLLGEGVRLFKEKPQNQSLKLLSSKNFESGLTQLHYQLER